MRSLLKRILSLSLCFALVLILLPILQVDAAENNPLKYLFYTISNGEVTITDCDTSITGHLIIPNTIAGFPVSAIGEFAFSGCEGLTEIKLGNQITTIGKGAFSNCKGLTEIKLGNHITTIGMSAFANCPLSELTLPASVTSLDASSLNYMTRLETVVFLGDPPQFHKFTFGTVTEDPVFDQYWGMGDEYSEFNATVYYPMHNPKWTSDVMQRYGALSITWEGIHSRDEGTLIASATCTTEGATGYVCSVCSEIEIITTPALGHSWDKGTITAQPTCTQDGVRRYICTTCLDTNEEAISATGHSWDKGNVTTQPTCTQEGVRLYTCGNCSDTYIEAINPTGHIWGDTVVVGTVNCLEPVTVDHICKTCGTTGNRQTLTAPGHSYESILQSATCTQPGQIVYTCKTCGDVRSTETSPATGHQFTSGTCTHCGLPLIGDLNGDDTVDIADVACLYTHIKTNTPLTEAQLTQADVTGDEVVDIADVARLYAHAKGTNPLI